MAKYDAFIGAIPHLASMLREFATQRSTNNAESEARARQIEDDLRTFAAGLTDLSNEHKRALDQVSSLASRVQASDEQNRSLSQQLAHVRELYDLQRTSLNNLKTFCYLSLALNAVALIGLAILLARR